MLPPSTVGRRLPRRFVKDRPREGGGCLLLMPPVHLALVEGQSNEVPGVHHIPPSPDHAVVDVRNSRGTSAEDLRYDPGYGTPRSPGGALTE